MYVYLQCQLVCISDDLNTEKVISSSSARNQLCNIRHSVVGEAAKTVILKLTNAIKLLNGAGKGCYQDQLL